MARKKANNLPVKFTDAEQDLLDQMQHGYRLETDSLGGNPVLRRLKNNEMIRPADANANTVKVLQQRGVIGPGTSRYPLTIVWRLTKKTR